MSGKEIEVTKKQVNKEVDTTAKTGKRERTNIDTSYVMCLAHEELRDELRQLLGNKGLSYEDFADGFLEFLDEKGEMISGKKRLKHFNEYLKLVKKEELIYHGSFSWDGRFRKFMSGNIQSLNYGEVCLIKEFLQSYPDQKK